jgi:ribose transport system substrate-binding protein
MQAFKMGSTGRRESLGVILRRMAPASAALLVLASCGGTAQPSGNASGTPPPLSSVQTKYPSAVKYTSVVVDTSKWKKAAPWTIASIGVGPSNGFGLTYDAAVKYEASQDSRIKKLLTGSSNNDTTHEISVLEAIIAQKPDAIVIIPADAAALTAPIGRAMDAGIPVILCQNGITSDNFVSQVNYDSYLTGYGAADGLARQLNGKGNVVMLNGLKGVEISDIWQNAALDAFKYYPGIKVVAQSYDVWNVAKSTADVTAQMSRFTINGIFAGGAEMATGAALAFKQAGKPMPVFGVTNGDYNGWLRVASENQVKFVAAPGPATLSRNCIQTAAATLSGTSVHKFIDVTPLIPGAGLYNQDAVSQHYVAELSDDFDGPTNGVPVAYLASNGLGRK